MASFVEHLSLRVAWHDSGWNGTVCSDPIANASCILLKNVGPRRDDAIETDLAGHSLMDGTPTRCRASMSGSRSWRPPRWHW